MLNIVKLNPTMLSFALLLILGIGIASFNVADLDLTGKATDTSSSKKMIRENVTCIFTNSNPNNTNKCYSEKGICSGIKSCSLIVKGYNNELLNWKSTCGDYASTTIDGLNEYAEFDCGNIVKENVNCIFSGSTSLQQCSSDKGKCSGVKTCLVRISGYKGEQVKWYNTCDKKLYYTNIDSNDKSIRFACSKSQ